MYLIIEIFCFNHKFFYPMLELTISDASLLLCVCVCVAEGGLSATGEVPSYRLHNEIFIYIVTSLYNVLSVPVLSRVLNLQFFV